MKKVLLSGLCVVMLAGSSHQSDAMDTQDYLVGGAICAVGCAIACSLYAVGYSLSKGMADICSFSHAKDLVWEAELYCPEVFELLKDPFLSKEEIAERAMVQCRADKYKCRSAIVTIYMILNKLDDASRSFHILEERYLCVFSRCARARRKDVDRMRDRARDIIVTLRESETYAAEKAEQERVAALDREHKITLDKVEDLGVEIS